MIRSPDYLRFHAKERNQHFCILLAFTGLEHISVLKALPSAQLFNIQLGLGKMAGSHSKSSILIQTNQQTG